MLPLLIPPVPLTSSTISAAPVHHAPMGGSGPSGFVQALGQTSLWSFPLQKHQTEREALMGRSTRPKKLKPHEVRRSYELRKPYEGTEWTRVRVPFGRDAGAPRQPAAEMPREHGVFR